MTKPIEIESFNGWNLCRDIGKDYDLSVEISKGNAVTLHQDGQAISLGYHEVERFLDFIEECKEKGLFI